MRTIGICIFVAGLAMAQHHDSSGENPVVLYHGLGVWRHSIQTANGEAQKFFDQGLALMYGFNRYEALRSFRKAAELDPHAAMAYWGMAMAQGPYINMEMDADYNLKASCEAAEAGLKVKDAPEPETAYLRAAAVRCPEYQPQRYIDAMREITARWPDDLDALTLYAESLMVPNRWHWYGADGKPKPGQAEAEQVLEQVLRRWPDHPGANHLYIHAVESSPTPERAIASAQRLMGVMPEAGHMVHMPGHIWLVLGDYEMAAAVNERAAAVDREYVNASHVASSGYAPYMLHNLHFVAYARWMQGKKADGLLAADVMAQAMAPLVETMPEMVDSFNAWTLFGRVRFGEWDAILQSPQPKAVLPLTSAIWHYARALALAARGDRAGAAHEQAEFEAIRGKVPAAAPWGMNQATKILAMAGEIIAARLAPTPAAAVPHWRQAVSMQDRMVYDEPPAWYYPLRESLGAALLLSNNPTEAEQVFREGIRRSPRNGRMLFGLMEALRAQGKADAAASVKREFEAAWAKADVTPRLEDL